MNPTKSILQNVFFLIVLICGISCQPSTSEDNTTTDTPGTSQLDTVAETPREAGDDNIMSDVQGKTDDCEVPGKRLEDNDFRVPDSELLVSIVADSTTTDPEFGDSYRIFQVFDQATCQIVYRETLPINFSPDYPYYLSPESYTESAQVICTPGYDLLYCFDLKNNQALPKMKPTENTGESVDAQSGMPVGVIGLKNYLIGYTINRGGYAFDIKNKMNPREITPAAIYDSPDEETNSLFFLAETSDTYRAVMPVIDDQGHLQAKDLFGEALDINPNLPANIRDNRYLVFKDLGRDEQLAIDMEVQEAVELPADLRNQSVQTILQWLKTR